MWKFYSLNEFGKPKYFECVSKNSLSIIRENFKSYNNILIAVGNREFNYIMKYNDLGKARMIIKTWKVLVIEH